MASVTKLARGQKTGCQTFRILSLDGGGIKGAFTASVLAVLEEQTGLRTADHFDLITGTSTGGILAIGLGLGFSAADLLQFYIERGPIIFPSTSLKSRFGLFRQFFRPKHSHQILREELVGILGDRHLRDSKCRLVIPTYDAIKGRIYIMKTCHRADSVFDGAALAVDVAMATSAAPTYFSASPFPKHNDASYVDGGVWANCPALVGVTEAISFLDQAPANIDVLSIGTTSTPFNISRQRNMGAAGWNLGVIELMFEAQVEAARAHAKLIAGNFHRIDALVPASEFALDRADVDTIRKLAVHGRGEGVKREHLSVAKDRFFNGTFASTYKNYC